MVVQAVLGVKEARAVMGDKAYQERMLQEILLVLMVDGAVMQERELMGVQGVREVMQEILL